MTRRAMQRRTFTEGSTMGGASDSVPVRGAVAEPPVENTAPGYNTAEEIAWRKRVIAKAKDTALQSVLYGAKDPETTNARATLLRAAVRGENLEQQYLDNNSEMGALFARYHAIYAAMIRMECLKASQAADPEMLNALNLGPLNRGPKVLAYADGEIVQDSDGLPFKIGEDFLVNENGSKAIVLGNAPPRGYKYVETPLVPELTEVQKRQRIHLASELVSRLRESPIRRLTHNFTRGWGIIIPAVVGLSVTASALITGGTFPIVAAIVGTALAATPIGAIVLGVLAAAVAIGVLLVGRGVIKLTTNKEVNMDKMTNEEVHKTAALTGGTPAEPGQEHELESPRLMVPDELMEAEPQVVPDHGRQPATQPQPDGGGEFSPAVSPITPPRGGVPPDPRFGGATPRPTQTDPREVQPPRVPPTRGEPARPFQGGGTFATGAAAAADFPAQPGAGGPGRRAGGAPGRLGGSGVGGEPPPHPPQIGRPPR